VNREQFLKGQAATADGLAREGMASRLRSFEELPTRASFKAKDPRGFAEFMRQAGEHDAGACAHLAREVMAKRRTVPELEAPLRALRAPTLIMVGDQDAPCVEPSMMMRALIPHAGLVVFPACGHTPNIEEPGLFNLHVAEFLAAVERGRWAGWTGSVARVEHDGCRSGSREPDCAHHPGREARHSSPPCSRSCTRSPAGSVSCRRRPNDSGAPSRKCA
jgi:hypothetical protein